MPRVYSELLHIPIPEAQLLNQENQVVNKFCTLCENYWTFLLEQGLDIIAKIPQHLLPGVKLLCIVFVCIYFAAEFKSIHTGYYFIDKFYMDILFFLMFGIWSFLKELFEHTFWKTFSRTSRTDFHYSVSNKKKRKVVSKGEATNPFGSSRSLTFSL